MIVRRSALVPHSAERLFDLIEAAEHYPRFLPWCSSATILYRRDDEVSADLVVQWHGLSFSVRTRNPKRRPEHMSIHLAQGPFQHFEGQWQLKPLDVAACKVDFSLDCAFDSPVMTQLAGPVLGHLANGMVDAFVARAQALYGDG